MTPELLGQRLMRACHDMHRHLTHTAVTGNPVHVSPEHRSPSLCMCQADLDDLLVSSLRVQNTAHAATWCSCPEQLL